MSSRDERIEYFVERQSNGQLDSNDVAELAELFEDPDAAREFVEALTEQHEWRRAFQDSRGDAFLEVVVERSRRAGSSGRFLRSVTEIASRENPVGQETEPERRIQRRSIRRAKRSSGGFWFPAVIAAGVAAAVLVFLAMPKPQEKAAGNPQAESIAQITSGGDGRISNDTAQKEAATNAPLYSGDTLVAQNKAIRFQFAGEGTFVELHPGSKLVLKSSKSGKRMELANGGVSASVAPQNQPLVFATDFAEAKVLGTELSFTHEGQSARLRVDKGRVLLTRLKDGASVEVSTGQTGIAPADLSASIVLKPAALPAPWEHADIGAVKLPGSAVVHDEKFTIRASGTDIWERSDGFHFVYQPLEGDGEIVARVAGIQSAGEWAMAGLMIREKLTPDSVHATMMVTTQLKAKLRRRETSPGMTQSTGPSAGSVTIPKWLKLTRQGDTFKGFTSDDGRTWKLVDTDTIKFNSKTVYIGLMALTLNNAGLSTVVLESVNVSRPTPAQ